jgi:hypothetical protein
MTLDDVRPGCDRGEHEIESTSGSETPAKKALGASHTDPLLTTAKRFAVGCHRLPNGLFESFLGHSDLRSVATGCAR